MRKRLLLLLLAVFACASGAAAQETASQEEAPQEPAPRVASERIVLRMNVGDMVLALYPEVAPGHVEQLLKLARMGAYVVLTPTGEATPDVDQPAERGEERLGDEPLRDRAQPLGLGLGGGDLAVLEQALHEVPPKRDAMFRIATQLPAADHVGGHFKLQVDSSQ